MGVGKSTVGRRLAKRLGLPFAAAVMLWPRDPTPDLWIGDGGTQAAWTQAGEAVVMRPGVRQFAVDVWSRRRGVDPVERPVGGWVCSRSACAPAAPNARPLALWWGRTAPAMAEIDGLCRSATVVSIRATVGPLPASCQGRLVLDGTDHARGGAVELWRDGAGWRAVWTSGVRGDRPWSLFGDPDVSDSGG
jgi:competence protein ComEC